MLPTYLLSFMGRLIVVFLAHRKAGLVDPPITSHGMTQSPIGELYER